MWGGLCCISLTFAYFLVPETKGLSLEQVDRMLEETSPRTSSKWVPHSTFAADMGLVNRGENSTSVDEGLETVEIGNEKSMV